MTRSGPSQLYKHGEQREEGQGGKRRERRMLGNGPKRRVSPVLGWHAQHRGLKVGSPPQILHPYQLRKNWGQQQRTANLRHHLSSKLRDFSIEITQTCTSQK